MSVDASELSTLTYARYGKTNVRVFRIVREGKFHHTVEYNVETLLEGDIQVSYTEADNSVVVATDSVKNITYYLAKVSPHILNPEKFALHIGTFFASKYTHIHKVHVKIEQLRWKRISIDGQEHPHSFYRDGDDKRVVSVVVDATAGKHALVADITSGLVDLLVLKSSGSAFENFWKDEYTTLTPVDDRIFSTSVDLSYTFKGVKLVAPQDEKRLEFQVPLKQGDEDYAGSIWDEDVPTRARDATLQVFATDESASVQATLYKMAQRIIAENRGVQDVTYTLPNKHYIPVDMRYIGLDNLTPCVFPLFSGFIVLFRFFFFFSCFSCAIQSSFKAYARTRCYAQRCRHCLGCFHRHSLTHITFNFFHLSISLFCLRNFHLSHQQFPPITQVPDASMMDASRNPLTRFQKINLGWLSLPTRILAAMIVVHMLYRCFFHLKASLPLITPQNHIRGTAEYSNRNPCPRRSLRFLFYIGLRWMDLRPDINVVVARQFIATSSLIVWDPA